MWICHIASILLAAAACGQHPANQRAVKEWRFPLQHGEARIALERGLGDRLVLEIVGPPCVPCATLQEMSSAVATVIEAMPKAGLDPAKIDSIGTGIDEQEVRDRVAAVAVRSGAWRSCMKIAGCGGNDLLVTFLNQTGAFQSYGTALKKYGLTVEVASAEKVSVERASSIRGLELPPGVTRTTKVPVNANLVINVIKMK